MSTTQKTAVVTGATGLIGSHLVAELLGRGYHIRLLVRERQRLHVLHDTLSRFGLEERFGGIETIEASLLNPVQMSRLMQGCEAVFHCAGMVSYDPAKEAQIIETNTSITANAANAALMAGVGVFVHVSSIATLGETQPPAGASRRAGPELITEDCRLTSLKGRSAYSASKFYAENEVWRASAQGLRTVIVNPAIVLGEGPWERSSGPLIAQAIHGSLFYTDGVKGYVDVRDVARAMVTLSQTEAAMGKRFILSAANLSFRELFTLAARAAGKHPPRLRAGRKILALAAALERGHRRFWGGEVRLSPPVVTNALDTSRYDGSRISRTCYFTYTPIEQTLSRVVGAYLKDTAT